MLLNDRRQALIALGDYLKSALHTEDLSALFGQARNQNPWFTEDNVRLALTGIAEKYLDENVLLSVSETYQLPPETPNPRAVGIVAAGNIPAVGMHDLICTFLSGHRCLFKPGSTDLVLPKFLIDWLHGFDPRTAAFIQLADRLNHADAVIATGSNNTARYFEYYFGKKPHIIRKNRTSVALLDGSESHTDLSNLGNDIFTYFGLGCRNVSKMYVPEGYDFSPFFRAIEYWNTIMLHHKYTNNYDYNKSVLLVNREPHLDNGFLLVRQDEQLVSPLSVVYYEEYQNAADLTEQLAALAENIQCKVGSSQAFTDLVPFGHSQEPAFTDYADGVDTMKFLTEL